MARPHEHQQDLCLIDLETTHLDPALGDVVQASITILRPTGPRCEKYRLIFSKTWNMLARAHKERHPKALEVNGYDQEVWLKRGVFTHEQFIREFVALTAGCKLGGANVSFDWSFLTVLFAEFNVEFAGHYRKLDVPSMAWPVQLARVGLRSTGQYDLGKFLNVPNLRPHQADGDVEQLVGIYNELLSLYRWCRPMFRLWRWWRTMRHGWTSLP